MRGKRSIVILLLLNFLGVDTLRANWVAVSHLDNDPALECQPFEVSSARLIAGSFRTGDREVAGSILVSVSISVASITQDPPDSTSKGLFEVDIWDSRPDGSPNNIVEGLYLGGYPSASGSDLKPGVLTFYSVGLHLPPEAQFWVGAYVHGSDDMKVAVRRTASPSENSFFPGWSSGNFSYLFANGRTSFDYSCAPEFSVQICIPEPNPFLMFALSAGGLIAIRARFSRCRSIHLLDFPQVKALDLRQSPPSDL